MKRRTNEAKALEQIQKEMKLNYDMICGALNRIMICDSYSEVELRIATIDLYLARLAREKSKMIDLERGIEKHD